MGFRIGTIVVQGNSKRARMQISKQVMDLNYLTWIFNLFLAKHLCFGQSHPPTPPHLPLVAPFCWVSYGGAKGVMLQQDKYIFGNYGITDAKGHLWVWNKKLVMMHPQIP